MKGLLIVGSIRYGRKKLSVEHVLVEHRIKSKPWILYRFNRG